MKDEPEVINIGEMRDKMYTVTATMRRPALIIKSSPAKRDEKTDPNVDMYLVELYVYMTKADMMQMYAKSKDGVIAIEI